MAYWVFHAFPGNSYYLTVLFVQNNKRDYMNYSMDEKYIEPTAPTSKENQDKYHRELERVLKAENRRGLIYGITYSDENMTKAADRCFMSMLNNGVQEARRYGPNGIEPDFKMINREILSQERGCGYWLWKPYFIYHLIKKLSDGDILIYSDAGVQFVNHVHHIIDKMDEDIFFFTNGFTHVEWCKMDCLFSICPNTGHDSDGLTYVDINYKQVQASVIFFKVNETTRNFVKEWLLYCQMPGFIDDSPSKMPNYPTFAEHRHDQSVLTCLQIKYRYNLHWWPTQYSEHIRIPGDEYPVMFNHHRKRNNEW